VLISNATTDDTDLHGLTRQDLQEIRAGAEESAPIHKTCSLLEASFCVPACLCLAVEQSSSLLNPERISSLERTRK